MVEEQDERLAYEIEHRIGRMPEIQLGDLRVTVSRGYARIQGVVRSLRDKQAALEAARAVPGVLAVDEAIAVETPHVPQDRRLSEDLGEALDEEEDVDVARVGAVSQRGTGVLMGSAQSIHELGRAGETVEAVRGMIDTRDSSRIENPYGADRIDLANAVSDAFRDDPVLRTRSIRPQIQDTGKLVLTGTVRSEAERRQALEVASRVPGVHTVVEDLDVVP